MGCFSTFFAGEANSLRRALLRQFPEADHPLTSDLQAVAAHERFLTVRALHEGAVGALVDEHELVTVDLDTRVQVAMGANRGRIQIEFSTLDDLERIYGVITKATPPT